MGSDKVLACSTCDNYLPLRGGGAYCRIFKVAPGSIERAGYCGYHTAIPRANSVTGKERLAIMYSTVSIAGLDAFDKRGKPR